jgi:hypothetical protein
LASENLLVASNELVRKLRLRVDEPKLFFDNALDSLANLEKQPLLSLPIPHELADLQLTKVHEANIEKANSIAIYNALPGLSAAEATDERIWFSLATGTYREYAFGRWLNSEDSAQKKSADIRNHLFASSPRNRFRDHAIARLWWISHYCQSVIGKQDADKALTVLNLQRRFAGDFLDRSGISNSPGLARAVMRVAYKYRDRLGEKGDSTSLKFREVMLNLDLISGRKAVAYPDYEHFEDSVDSLFRATFGISK